MTHLQELWQLIAEAPISELPALIGELEALRAAAWAKLTVPSTPAPAAPTLVDAAEMASMLGTPETWVRDKARAGKLPSIHMGHYVRFEPAAVIEACRKLRLSGASYNGPLCRIEKPQQKRRGKRYVSNECPSSSAAERTGA